MPVVARRGTEHGSGLVPVGSSSRRSRCCPGSDDCVSAGRSATR